MNITNYPGQKLIFKLLIFNIFLFYVISVQANYVYPTWTEAKAGCDNICQSLSDVSTFACATITPPSGYSGARQCSYINEGVWYTDENLHLVGSCPEGETKNPVTNLCESPKDCADKYNDLDIFTAGIQCTCTGGFPPISLDGGLSATCDGVKQNCGISEQKQYVTDGNVEYAICQEINICDPNADPNFCQPEVAPACDFQIDPDACARIEVDITDDPEIFVCPDGYVYNSVY